MIEYLIIGLYVAGSPISTWENNYKAKSGKDSEARRGTSGSSPDEQSDDDIDDDPDLEGEGLCEQSPHDPTDIKRIRRYVFQFPFLFHHQSAHN